MNTETKTNKTETVYINAAGHRDDGKLCKECARIQKRHSLTVMTACKKLELLKG